MKNNILLVLVFILFCTLEAQAQAINDNGTNVGIGAPAPNVSATNNVRLLVDGGLLQNTSGSRYAQQFRTKGSFNSSSYSAGGSLGWVSTYSVLTRTVGVRGYANVSKAISTSFKPSVSFGGSFTLNIKGISGNKVFNIGGVRGILSGKWNGHELPDGYAGAVVGIDNIKGKSTHAGYFDGNVRVIGNIRSGFVSNPAYTIYNENNKYLQFGVASCNGCYGSFAKPGDGVMRVLGGGDLIFAIPGTNGNRKIAFHSSGDKIMTIQEVGTSGKVGVGTTNFPTTIGGANISAYKLFVKGGILTEEVRVRTGWADYVFDKNYNLKSLDQVEKYIAENGHLPNVPSAQTVAEEGIELGDIAKIQQEKIEELTLYLIQQKKEIEGLKKENQNLKSLAERLTVMEDQLKKLVDKTYNK